MTNINTNKNKVILVYIQKAFMTRQLIGLYESPRRHYT